MQCIDLFVVSLSIRTDLKTVSDTPFDLQSKLVSMFAEIIASNKPELRRTSSLQSANSAEPKHWNCAPPVLQHPGRQGLETEKVGYQMVSEAESVLNVGEIDVSASLL